MQCPVCNNALTEKLYYQVPIHVCTQCGGIWFEQGELKEYIDDMLIERQDIPDLPISTQTIPAIGEIKIKEPVKPCPKCQQTMTPYNYCYNSNVILDKCAPCQGIWVDGGKIEQIAQYHKVNPDVAGIGEGLAEFTAYNEKIKDIAMNWRNARGNWHWTLPW